MEIIEDKNHTVVDILGYPEQYPYGDKENQIDILNRIYT